jgi:hypothetical protein
VPDTLERKEPQSTAEYEVLPDLRAARLAVEAEDAGDGEKGIRMGAESASATKSPLVAVSSRCFVLIAR